MNEFNDTQTVTPAWERTKLDQPYDEKLKRRKYFVRRRRFHLFRY